MEKTDKNGVQNERFWRGFWESKKLQNHQNRRIRQYRDYAIFREKKDAQQKKVCRKKCAEKSAQEKKMQQKKDAQQKKKTKNKTKRKEKQKA